MKVYITKYALTRGIFVEVVEMSKTYPNMVFKDNGTGRLADYYHKPYWHTDLAEAVAQAEKMRKAKIVSLHKQIARLEKLDFMKIKGETDS